MYLETDMRGNNNATLSSAIIATIDLFWQSGAGLHGVCTMPRELVQL